MKIEEQYQRHQVLQAPNASLQDSLHEQRAPIRRPQDDVSEESKKDTSVDSEKRKKDVSDTKFGSEKSISQYSYEIQKSGLSLCAAVFFVVGDVVGAGLVAIPYTMKLSGWYAVIMFLLAGVISCCSGTLLAKACNIIMGDTSDREQLRDPYPTVAERAAGKTARHIVTLTLNLSQVMTCLVFLLLAGEILSKLVPLSFGFSYRNDLRLWFAITAGTMLPFTYFGSPKDFWLIAVLATLSSTIAAAMILANLGLAWKHGIRPIPGVPIKMDGVLASFGIIIFGFGGVAMFPTIQNDLKEPKNFQKAVGIGYCCVALMNISVPVFSYIVLGSLIREDILTTFTELTLYSELTLFRIFVVVAQAVICGHLLCAYVININPVHQQVEGYFDVPSGFCWQRICIRTFSMTVLLALAIAVPNFGPVLSFVGGSFAALLGIIFPLLFYARLQDKIACWKEVLFSIIMIIACFGAIGNGYVEIHNIYKVIHDQYED